MTSFIQKIVNLASIFQDLINAFVRTTCMFPIRTDTNILRMLHAYHNISTSCRDIIKNTVKCVIITQKYPAI